MSVLDRSELEASPLADLHAIADQLGLDGFRRLRKADLINAILGEPTDGRDGSDSGRDSDSLSDSEESGRQRADSESGRDSSDRSRSGSTTARKRRAPRLRRGAGSKGETEDVSADERESSSASRLLLLLLLPRIPLIPRAVVAVEVSATGVAVVAPHSRTAELWRRRRMRRLGRTQTAPAAPRAWSSCWGTAPPFCASIRPSLPTMTFTSPPRRSVAASSSPATG